MAPRKNTEKTSTPAKTAPEKTIKTKRVPKEKPVKPKLKTPTVIKVKIPSNKKTLQKDVKMTPKPRMKCPVSLKLSNLEKPKIDLANEVALAQLVKAEDMEDDIIPASTPEKKTRKKRGRPKYKKDTEETSTESAKNITKKTITKRVAKNAQVKAVQEKTETVNNNKSIATKKRRADSTSKRNMEPPAVKRSSRKRKLTADDVTPNNKRKGKDKDHIVDEVLSIDHQESPSILDPGKKTALEHSIKENSVDIPEVASPRPVDSRKTSMTSTSECMSWTKDISTSSTTTCITVCSNDFVRIDNKLPVVKLSNIDSKLKRPIDEMEPSDDSDSDSIDQNTKCTLSSSSESSLSERNSVSRSLNLSSPSASSKSQQSKYSHGHSSITTKDTECRYALDKLTSKLIQLDLEFINWLGHKNEDLNVEQKQSQDKILNVLKQEQEVLVLCDNIKRILEVDNNINVSTNDDKNEKAPEKTSNAHFVKPLDVALKDFIDKSEDDGDFTSSSSKYVMLDQTCEDSENPLEPIKVLKGSSDGEDNFTSDKVPYMAFDQNYNDDDDALSLFAESITGIESSKFNSSAASMSVGPPDFEEYVPEPLHRDKPKEGFSYRPSKIINTDTARGSNDCESSPISQNKTKAVCEKQNADSTSISRLDTHQIVEGSSNKKVPFSSLTNMTAAACPIAMPNPSILKPRPCLMASVYQPINAVKSVIFKGVCFFNLISNCKKAGCNFPHKPLDGIEVEHRLSRLSEDQFVVEYMLMRAFPVLRRMYGICYVNECAKRQLTRILLEMAIDFTVKAKLDSKEDAELKVNVIEHALMHLNNVDLTTCSDLLQYNCGSDLLLCDVFMRTIAETQNFSRFKLVFINLTNYIVDIKRRFSVDVASHILERVCILPYEAPLSRAVLKIIENTEVDIFDNSMMRQFEKNLSSLDNDLYQSFRMLRTQIYAKNPDLGKAYAASPGMVQELDQSLMHSDREKRYTSPDTTKLDNMNKAVEEPTIKRTMDYLPHMFNIPQNIANSPVSNDSDEYRPVVAKGIQDWRRTAYSPNDRFQARLVRPMRPPKRHLDQRHVAYGHSPSKFPRRPGLDFF